MLKEDDQELRKLKRDSETNPQIKKRYVIAMMRAGRSGEVLNPRKQEPLKRNRSNADIHAQHTRNYARAMKMINANKYYPGVNDNNATHNRYIRQNFIKDRTTGRATADIARISDRSDVEIPARRSLKLIRAASKHLKVLPNTEMGDKRLERLSDLATRAKFQATDRELGQKRGTAFKDLAQNWAKIGKYPAMKSSKWRKP